MGLLRAIAESGDKRFEFQFIYIHDYELINEDVLNVDIPKNIQKGRDTIKKVNAIIYGVAEYNHAVSAPLKNAYDWFSREDRHKQCEISGKPGAMVSVAGPVKGGYAQENFRQIVEYRGIKLLTPSP